MAELLEVKVKARVLCDCGMVFEAEEPQMACPYCGRSYVLEVSARVRAA